ncbi:Kinesin-like protein [Symbiodinium microadriaticum]|uniref:Kinesin-like protein n=1 Tax=Symbiodinium microadriaticum TaxID=2951 RepID=A0A1Q9DEK9_SYMMI|nr:Kinesin-like protein [Symbiodinium microadriaticum]
MSFAMMAFWPRSRSIACLRFGVRSGDEPRADGLKNDAAVSEDLSPSKSKRATTKPRGTVAEASKVPGATGTPDGSPNPNSIRVAVRIRPFSAKELGEGGLAEMVLDIVETTVISKGVDRYGHDSDYVKSKQFTFDSVFNSTDPGMEEGSQAQVFQELGVPILENALDAYNGCIMAYGQTGSGKSYRLATKGAAPPSQNLGWACAMAMQVAYRLPIKDHADRVQSDLIKEPRSLGTLSDHLDKETKNSHESLLEATGWKMQLRDFVQLSLGPGLSSFRTMVSSSRRVNMQPDVDESRFATPEQDLPSSPCAGRRFLRFGDPSFISPPSSYSLSASSPTSPTSPASTQSCSPRATSALPASCASKAAEEEEEEDDESDMKFVQAVTDRRHRTKLRYSVACARSVDALPSLEVIRPQKSSLWLRRRRTTSDGSKAQEPKTPTLGRSLSADIQTGALANAQRLPMVALRILKSAQSTNTGDNHFHRSEGVSDRKDVPEALANQVGRPCQREGAGFAATGLRVPLRDDLEEEKRQEQEQEQQEEEEEEEGVGAQLIINCSFGCEFFPRCSNVDLVRWVGLKLALTRCDWVSFVLLGLLAFPALERPKGTDKTAGMAVGSPGRQRRNQWRAVGLKLRRELAASLGGLLAHTSVHLCVSEPPAAMRSQTVGNESHLTRPSKEFAGVLKDFMTHSDLDAALFFRQWSLGGPDRQTMRLRDLFPIPPLTTWPAGVSTGALCQQACLDTSNMCLGGLNHLNTGMKASLTQPMSRMPSKSHREVQRHVCQRVVRFLLHLEESSARTLGWRNSFAECESAGSPSYEDICSEKVDLPDKAGTCNPCAVIPAELRELITDPKSVFPSLVSREGAAELQLGQYRDLVVQELRCGKLFLRDEAKGIGGAFAVGKSSGRQRKIWSV